MKPADFTFSESLVTRKQQENRRSEVRLWPDLQKTGSTSLLIIIIIIKKKFNHWGYFFSMSSHSVMAFNKSCFCLCDVTSTVGDAVKLFRVFMSANVCVYCGVFLFTFDSLSELSQTIKPRLLCQETESWIVIQSDVWNSVVFVPNKRLRGRVMERYSDN